MEPKLPRVLSVGTYQETGDYVDSLLSPLHYDPIQTLITYKAVAFGSLPLPETVQSNKGEFPVSWSQGPYNSSLIGIYTITGDVTLPPEIIGDDTVTMKVSTFPNVREEGTNATYSNDSCGLGLGDIIYELLQAGSGIGGGDPVPLNYSMRLMGTQLQLTPHAEPPDGDFQLLVQSLIDWSYTGGAGSPNASYVLPSSGTFYDAVYAPPGVQDFGPGCTFEDVAFSWVKVSVIDSEGNEGPVYTMQCNLIDG